MKKALVYSLVFHIILILLAFFLVQEKKEKGSAPFYARIVTPDELETPSQERVPSSPGRMQPPRGSRSLPAAPRRERQIAPAPPPKTTPPRRPEAIPPSRGGALSPAERVPPPPPSQRGTPGEILPAPGAPGVQSPEGAQSESAPRSPGDSANRTPKTTRQKLFDSDVIAKLTEPSKQSEKKESGITFDTTEFKYYGYLQRLKEKIQGIWRYPPDAADRGIYGDLYIRFTIKKNGRLGAVELVRTSGYRSLDDAAIKALWDGDPYWPLPDEWGRDGFTITGHFVYTLHGMHVR